MATLSRHLGVTCARARAGRVAVAALAVPGLAIVAADFAQRPARLLAFAPELLASYAASALVSAALWGALLCLAAGPRDGVRRGARAGLAIAALLALGSQLYMFVRYESYMNGRAVLVGTSMLPSVGQQLWSDRASVARAVVPPLLAALVLPWLAGALPAVRRVSRWLAADVIIAALVLALTAPQLADSDEQASTPDILYFAAVAELAHARWDHAECVERVHPGARSPEAVPPLVAAPTRKRNVLVLLTESVRAQSACVAYDPACAYTPFSNAAAPARIPLRQMRSLASTTAISLAVMMSGLRPTDPRDALHSAPLLWEYAHAARLDTAYWTSQNLLFGNAGAFLAGLPFSRTVSANQLEPEAALEVGADDKRLADYVAADLAELHEPFVAVVHLSNTHYPYKIDDAFAPFQPESVATGPGYEIEIRNRYQDAIYLQDRAVGQLLRDLRARPEGARTVVVYLSDHGEQMREKGAVGHTGTLFEEEIRIPFWVDAPDGTLTEREAANLRALDATPRTTADVLPTLLDLAGVWDEPGVAPFRARMAGESLLRGGSAADTPRVLTNCTELWACAFKNWGALQGTRKLIAHQGDRAWSCFDVATDPSELRDLGPAACADLVPLAEGDGRGRPF